ncbi:hypothetical protein BHM03_00011327 [Ensete ventricosum]|nr:hypothetical protein BHM03_00011327 [Ensete ventricosum]
MLPNDLTTTRRLKHIQPHYREMNEWLYKKSFSMPLHRCLTPSEAEDVMAKIHEGICGEHIGGRALAFKILRQGYYWPW